MASLFQVLISIKNEFALHGPAFVLTKQEDIVLHGHAIRVSKCRKPAFNQSQVRLLISICQVVGGTRGFSSYSRYTIPPLNSMIAECSTVIVCALMRNATLPSMNRVEGVQTNADFNLTSFQIKCRCWGLWYFLLVETFLPKYQEKNKMTGSLNRKNQQSI